MSTSPIIDKAKLLAKSKANLARADKLVAAVAALPFRAASRAPATLPAPTAPAEPAQPAKDGDVHLSVRAVEGETLGETTVRKMLKNRVLHGAALSELVYRAPDSMPVKDVIAVMRANSERAASGDLSDLQAMLASQSVVLDGIFSEFARRAALSKNNDDLERMLRIALKAQSQSRTTVESLAVIQQGPAIFARQANVSNGGNQQVNNNGAPATPPSRARTVKAKEAKQTIPKVAP